MPRIKNSTFSELEELKYNYFLAIDKVFLRITFVSFLAFNTYMEAGFLLVFAKTMLIINFILPAHAEMNSMK